MHTSVRRPRFTVLAICLALLLGVLAVTAANDRATAAGGTYSFFTATTTPTVKADVDKKAVELGMKFKSSVAGTVTGVRFYKATTNTGTHYGSLWSRTGTRLGYVKFINETGSGWQQATFAQPISITANTVYIISYLAPVGQYAADEGVFDNKTLTSGPLTALANGTDGGNGVYRYGTGGGFPQSTYKSTNYYVDVIFNQPYVDDVKPTITTKTPADGATGVSRSTVLTATFSEPVNPATINATLTTGTAPNETTVPITTSYEATARMLTIRPTVTLANTTVYKATISGAKDTSDLQNQMDPVSWSFTTASDPGNCPCTIFANAVPGVPSANDNGAIALGVRFRAATDGYITGLRFYKGATSNGGTHTGTLWTNAGVKIAKLTFTGESASGWQTATFPAPVKITANTTYVASYFAPTGYYSAQNDYFTNTSTTNGPLTALANGIDGLNGAYGYGGDAFPTNEYRQTNYFVDVNFDTSAVDGLAPTVVAKAPAANSDGVALTTVVSATFSEDVVASSVSFTLARTSNSAAVAGTTAYDAANQRATFTPSTALAYSTQYTATVSGAQDPAGNVMSPVTWTFTTAAEPAGPPDQGPGGPIAVVTSSANPYSKYYAEILRTEGLNEFATIDSATISAGTLASYDTVLLGDVPISADQVSTLSTWVNGGGNLIAMHPNATLSSLLGLTSAGTSIANGYLKVDPATKPGAGIVSETIQYHGSADRYTVTNAADTKTVAALYSDATTAAGNPAVTLRAVGTAGGEAAAFTYDLAKSVALSRQGNIAWAGTERDNYSPNGNPNVIRSDDYFFGGSTDKDWIDFTKVAIPQADEQQRLLANLIQTVNRDKKPLPRFWYFPNNYKAVVVGTGDDHASPNGTAGRFDQMIANSPANCSVNDWTCYRYSSYMFNGGPLSDAAASDYVGKGFEVALHTRTTPNDPSTDYTAASIGTIYSQQLAAFKSQYPSVPNPKSVRMHAIAFSDWASQPKTEAANGIRTDTNYYYFPASWIQDRPGFMTGSGMAMRFTDTDGSIIDNYQAATQMTDESGQTFPYTVDTLLDNALDTTKGYYGSFVANFHTDQPTEPQSDALIASAKARNVPIISAKQLTDWLDGRNASSYAGIGWASNKLTFTVKVGGGANNLMSMVPTAGPGGNTLSAITQNGTAVSFTKSTVKGLEYASFKASSATYVATYSGGSAAMAVKSSAKANTKLVAGTLQTTADVNTGTVQEAPEAATTQQTANLSWTTTKPATSEVLIGTSPADLGPAATVAESTTKHTVAVDDLEPSTAYYYRVVSTDSTGKSVTSPAADEAPAKLVTAAADITAPVASEIVIAPSGTNAEVRWLTNEAAAGGVRITDPAGNTRERQVSRKLTLDHSFTLTDLLPGRTYQIVIGSQDVAGNRSVSTPYRLITPSPGTGQTSSATFRLGSSAGAATVSDTGDGAITLAGAITSSRSGTFVSGLLDARRMVDWDRANFGVSMPTGASGALYVRTGSTDTVDSSWTGWVRITGADRWRVDAASRFIQYKVDLSAGAGILAPTVYSMGFSSNSDQVVDLTEGG